MQNKEKVRQRVYYQSHKEQIKAQVALYRLTNPEKIKAYSKKYHQAHKERIKAYQLAHAKEIKAWRQANDERYRLHCRKRRALKHGANHKPYTDSYIFERDGWICGICGLKIDKRLRKPNLLSKSIDHIIPISKGGADAPINLQATHLICNIGKQATNRGQLRLFG